MYNANVYFLIVALTAFGDLFGNERGGLLLIGQHNDMHSYTYKDMLGPFNTSRSDNRTERQDRSLLSPKKLSRDGPHIHDEYGIVISVPTLEQTHQTIFFQIHTAAGAF